jgi:hypothetical protein
MAYGTTERLPVIVDYDKAERLFNDTKPVRGTTDDKHPNGIRPLASRRDKHLRIDKKVDEKGATVYELICYNHPVITVSRESKEEAGLDNPRTFLTLRPYYVSSYTCDFLRNLLWTNNRPEFNIKGARIVMHMNGNKYALSEKDTITIYYDRGGESGGKFHVHEAEPIHAYAPDKQKYAAATAPYKEFADYYKGFVSLLTQQNDLDEREEGNPFMPRSVVRVPVQTFIDAFGVVKDKMSAAVLRYQHAHEYLKVDEWRMLFNKPVWTSMDDIASGRYEHATKQVAEWRKCVESFLTIVRSGQPEETKTENFYRGALVLMAAHLLRTSSNLYLRPNIQTYEFSRTAADALPREFFLYAFAEEVMETKRYAVGKMPSVEYGKYMFGKGKS